MRKLTYVRRELESAKRDLGGFLRDYLAELLAEVQVGACLPVVAAGQPLPAGPGWRHHHRHAEVFFQLAGSNHFRFPRGALTLPEGGVAVIPPRLAHEETREPRHGLYAHLCMVVSDQGVGCHLAALPPLAPDGRMQVAAVWRAAEPGSMMGPLLGALIARGCAPACDEGIVLRGLTLALLGFVRESFMDRPRPELHRIVAACRQRVQAGLANPDLGTPELAAAVGCHPDYLSRLYHRQTGQRLRSYIVEQRIRLAREVLITTRIPVQDVARLSGFRDHAYFSSRFRVLTGCTPERFRADAATGRTGT